MDCEIKCEESCLYITYRGNFSEKDRQSILNLVKNREDNSGTLKLKIIPSCIDNVEYIPKFSKEMSKFFKNVSLYDGEDYMPQRY